MISKAFKKQISAEVCPILLLKCLILQIPHISIVLVILVTCVKVDIRFITIDPVSLILCLGAVKAWVIQTS